MDGVLWVDKPRGCTSFDVVDRVRRALGAETAGHTGALDPRATGLLVILVGRAVKLAPFLSVLEKTYETTFRLGVVTTTDDLDGEVTGERPPVTDRAAIEAALRGFVGPIDQRPPAYSAVKVGGVRAYRRARRGETVDLPVRRVTVQAIEPLSFEPLRLRVVCSAGTYVRALARDLGERLGCGAAVDELRRTRVGPFAVEAAVADAAAGPAHVRPPEEAVGFLPTVRLEAEALRDFVNGKPVAVEGEGVAAVFGPAGFVGIGRRRDGALRPARVLYGR
jgi:tRNA pseudouridine55 synthase